MNMKKRMLVGLIASAGLLGLGNASAACSTSQLTGVWDFTFTGIELAGYCKGIKFGTGGKLVSKAGSCRATELNNDLSSSSFSAEAISLTLGVNSGCNLKVSPSKPARLRVSANGETDTMVIKYGRMNRDGNSLIMTSYNGGWPINWHGIKK